MKQKIIFWFIAVSLFSMPLGEAAAQLRSQYEGLSRYIGKEAVTTLDSAQIRITYSLNYVPDSNKMQEVMRDRKVLLIGNEWTHFYSDYVRQADSVFTADYDAGKNTEPLTWPSDIAGEGYEVFTNIATQKRTVLEPVTNLLLYSYDDEVRSLQWEISNDTCRILNYFCQKANAHFRGRDWTVWFTSEIPLNTGPWKLGGLPGLILKAADSKNHYIFECIGVEQLRNAKQPIIMLHESPTFIKCHRKAYRRAQQQFYVNHINVLLSLGFNINIEDNEQRRIDFLETPNNMFEEQYIYYVASIKVDDRYKNIPYNPIELE